MEKKKQTSNHVMYVHCKLLTAFITPYSRVPVTSVLARVKFFCKYELSGRGTGSDGESLTMVKNHRDRYSGDGDHSLRASPVRARTCARDMHPLDGDETHAKARLFAALVELIQESEKGDPTIPTERTIGAPADQHGRLEPRH